ncbi:hypothetical protein Syun_000979 [Stephania yunnanensis]|uniref:non-specific serine/threonine protein kinase n=1 Tax=Stephania yunnanensis TaxID=152371 RepID=A0AAP0LGZ2_9MAGN
MGPASPPLPDAKVEGWDSDGLLQRCDSVPVEICKPGANNPWFDGWQGGEAPSLTIGGWGPAPTGVHGARLPVVETGISPAAAIVRPPPVASIATRLSPDVRVERWDSVGLLRRRDSVPVEMVMFRYYLLMVVAFAASAYTNYAFRIFEPEHIRYSFFSSNGPRENGIRCPGVRSFYGMRSARIIPIMELEHATSNFCQSNLIGEGGFGIVYKGLLQDGYTVAIKRRLHGPTQYFVNEIVKVGPLES